MTLLAKESALLFDVVVDTGFADSELGDKGGVGRALATALPDGGGALESPFDLAGDGDASFR